MVDNHKGKILEYQVINNGKLTAVEIAKGMGVSRTTLYKWYDRPDVPENIIEKFCNLTGVSPDVFEKTESRKPDEIVYKENLDKVIDGLLKTINMYEKMMEKSLNDNEFIKEDALVYRTLVQKGIKEGAIQFGKATSKKN